MMLDCRTSLGVLQEWRLIDLSSGVLSEGPMPFDSGITGNSTESLSSRSSYEPAAEDGL